MLMVWRLPCWALVFCASINGDFERRWYGEDTVIDHS